MSTLDRGKSGESLICNSMIEDGFRIVARNIREKFGEIDIVALEDDTLCFVEVRTREDTRLGHPLETVSLKKQSTIRRAAEGYLARNKICNCAIRFDVAYIVWSTMEKGYIRNAF